MFDLLYEDNHHLVVNKPGGLLVQGDQTRRHTLLDLVKADLKHRYRKPGNVYLGLVHRIDRPASGAVVLARTSKAASRLAAQFRERTVRKTYLVLVEGRIRPGSGRMEDRLQRTGYGSVVSPDEGKLATLAYEALTTHDERSLVEVNLETGRHHQIRVQFATRGHAVLGDERYGATAPFTPGAIALHAHRLAFHHVITGEEMAFEAPPPAGFPEPECTR